MENDQPAASGGPPAEDTGPLQLFSSKTELTSDGFCMETGQHWVYPVNYPERRYQLDFVRTALFQNTLVCLPTGLGKTFIAAVVMFNFYRWYPDKIIIFMAPTKPLVAQQIKACFNIIGIPDSDTAEMTGTTIPLAKRQQTWQTKKVFFATPQVVANDLVAQVCPANRVCCVVVDEAHRAKGNHSYCQVIKTLKMYNSSFRVLALSATPGSDKESITEVLKNLSISKMKILTDDSLEVKKYCHKRDVEVITVSSNTQLKEASGRLLNILSRYLAKLMQKGVVPRTANVSNLTFFQLKTYYDKMNLNPVPGVSAMELNDLKHNCLVAMNLSKAYEMLTSYGKGAFLSHIAQTKTESTNRFLIFTLEKDDDLKALTTDIQTNSFEHPKLQKLEEVLINHFLEAEDRCEDTKVIIFSEYRNSVVEIKEYISQHDPLIRPVAFIGQSKKGGIGLTQMEQKQIMLDFNANKFNTLISTCVGEEGLDIGEVDLIVCYDANKSPIRLVQRMGRTGRKRDGRVVLLLTEGREHQKYLAGKKQQTNVMKNIANWNVVPIINQISSPRMVPTGLTPELFRKILVIPKETGIGEFFRKTSKKSSTTTTLIDNASPFTSIDQIVSKWQGPVPDFEYFGEMERQPFLSMMSKEQMNSELENLDEANSSGFNPQDWREWLSSMQSPSSAPQSVDTGDLVSLMQLADRISNNNIDQLTQTAEIASEAANCTISYTDKLYSEIGTKKKTKSMNAAANKNQSSITKHLKKKSAPAKPLPPLFKDDDDFFVPRASAITEVQQTPRKQKSVAEEIELLIENLALLCKVAHLKTDTPFGIMMESTGELANTLKMEEKPDFDFTPPDISILDHIFADIRIQDKQTVTVVSKSTVVVTKMTPAKGAFTKKKRFTSTPIRARLPKRSSGSYVTANSSFDDADKENVRDLLSPDIAPESPIAVIKTQIQPSIQKKQEVLVPTVAPAAPAFDFNLDFDFESDESLQEVDINLKKPAQVPEEKVASSQETCFSDELLFGLAEKLEAEGKEVKQNVETVEQSEEFIEGSDDMDFGDLDMLEKHCQQIEAEVSLKQGEKSAVREVPQTSANADFKDDFDDDITFIDEDDLEAKINAAENITQRKKRPVGLGQTQDNPIVLSSEGSNDCHDVSDIKMPRKKDEFVLSSQDDFEDNSISEIGGSVTETNKGTKRPSEQLTSLDSEPPPVKKSKKKPKKNNFLLTQASLSGSDSDDEDGTQMDQYDLSFIQEHSTQVQGVDIQAEYLRSIKSPPLHGKFKIPDISNRFKCRPDANKSSDDAYLEDSFCVQSGDAHSESSDDHDVLEEMEKILRNKRLEKKKSRENIPVLPAGKKKLRRVIAPPSSDSDSDATDVKTSEATTSAGGSNAKDYRNVASTSGAAFQPRASQVKNVKDLPLKLPAQPEKTILAPSKIETPKPNVVKGGFVEPQTPTSSYHRPEGRTIPLKLPAEAEKPKPQAKVSPASSLQSRSGPYLSDSASFYSARSSVASDLLVSAASAEIVIIASSQQIQQAPNLVTCLNAKHKLKVVLKTLPNGIDYVLSERLAAMRIKIGDTSSYCPNSVLANSIQILKSYFPFGLIFFENDKNCPVPDVKDDYRAHRAPTWSNNLRKTLCFLRQNRVKFLFCENQEDTASYLANLCMKESKTDCKIEDVKDNSEDYQARLMFFSNLPHINIVKAMKLVKKFPVIADLFEACNTPAEIAGALEVDEAKAVALHKIFNMPLN